MIEFSLNTALLVPTALFLLLLIGGLHWLHQARILRRMN